MTFINKRLSPRVSAGFQGGPEFRSEVVSLKSGLEIVHQRWTMPMFRYEADYVELVDAGLGTEIRSAFMAARGKKNTFLFKDWGDYIATSEAIGTGDGLSTPMRLIKTYSFNGSEPLVRFIPHPVASTLVVYENGTPKAVTVGEGGYVTPSTAWASGAAITWSGQFDVEVRFGSDYYPFTLPSTKISTCVVDLVERKVA